MKATFIRWNGQLLSTLKPGEWLWATTGQKLPGGMIDTSLPATIVGVFARDPDGKSLHALKDDFCISQGSPPQGDVIAGDEQSITVIPGSKSAKWKIIDGEWVKCG